MKKSLYIWILAALLPLSLPSRAQRARYDVAHPGVVHLRTNLLYDAALLPSLGLEAGLSGRWSVLGGVAFNWMRRDASHHYYRVLTGDLELRYWPGGRHSYHFLRRGLHVGAYVAGYRYDLEFGHGGQQADFNYGGGLSAGYSVPLGASFSLDFGLGVGYVGGTFKKYNPEDSHYVLESKNRRNYVGPTKAEVALVWNIDLPKSWARRGR